MPYLTIEAIVIPEAAKYTAKEIRELIRDFKENNPNNIGISKRTDKNYLREWAAHALCYNLGIMRERSKEAYLQFYMSKKTILMYDILGSVALILLKPFEWFRKAFCKR